MALTDIEAGRLADNVFNVVGANKNLIINGAMQVAQRGTSSTTSGYGSVDRFFVQIDGGTVTHTQTAIASGTPYDEGFRNVLRLTNTATATGASDIRNPFQYIEAQTIANSGWNYASSTSYVTLSFWVRSSVAQEFYGYLRSFDGTEQAYSFSLGSLSADTWTKVTKTIPGNSNLTFDNNNGVGLQVNISPFFGTDYTDAGNTVNTWGAFASSSRTPDYTNTWAGTTNATFDVTGVQLEVGSVATPFEHRSFGDELARCERYYQIIRSCDRESYGSSTSLTGSIHYRTVMRANPTVEVTGALRWARPFYGNLTQNSANIGYYDSASASEYGALCTFGNFSVFGFTGPLSLNDTTNYITASAEL